MQERRKHMRIDDNLQIDHWPWKSLLVSSSVSENISSGGMCFPSLQRFEPPQQIGVSVHVPGFKEPIAVSAEVVWLQEKEDINYRFRIGIKFLKMSPAHRARLLLHLCNKLDSINAQ